MEAINMNLIGMDVSSGASSKSPVDGEGFSKILSMVMGEGEIEEATDESLAYLMDPSMINLLKTQEYMDLDNNEFKNIIGANGKINLDENLENLLGDSITKINLDLERITPEEAVVSNQSNLLGNYGSKTPRTEGGNDLDLQGAKVEDLKTKSFIEVVDSKLEAGNPEKSVNLQLSKEEATLNLNQRDMGLGEKLLKKNEKTEIKSFSIEDMQNSLRKIEVKSMDKVDVKVPVLSKENLEIVQDSMVKLMEIRGEGEKSTMNVRLIPKELGSVNISLTMEEGKLVAKILVENEQARLMFSSNMKLLSQSLQKQDISIEDIQIDLNFNNNPDSKDGDKNQPRRTFRRSEFAFEGIDPIKEMPIRSRTIDGMGMSILA